MRITRADKALTDMKVHLDWLRERRSPPGDKWHETDLAREVGFTEAMDMLRNHGARLIDPARKGSQALCSCTLVGGPEGFPHSPGPTCKGSQVCSDCNCTDGHFWPRCTETKGPGLTDNSPNGTLSANAPSGEPS